MLAKSVALGPSYVARVHKGFEEKTGLTPCRAVAFVAGTGTVFEGHRRTTHVVFRTGGRELELRWVQEFTVA